MSTDNCVHSFFGVSKLSADLYVQEYGKNLKLNTVTFRGGCLTGENHSGVELHGFLSYLIKCIIKKKTIIYMVIKENRSETIFTAVILLIVFGTISKSKTRRNL